MLKFKNLTVKALNVRIFFLKGFMCYVLIFLKIKAFIRPRSYEGLKLQTKKDGRATPSPQNIIKNFVFIYVVFIPDYEILKKGILKMMVSISV